MLTADSSTPTPILDELERIIAVLAGQPTDGSWDNVNEDISQNIETARSKCKFPKKAKKHRRGNCPAMVIGISHGGGQTVGIGYSSTPTLLITTRNPGTSPTMPSTPPPYQTSFPV